MYFKNNKKGAALTEYAMIAGLIGVVAVGTVYATGQEISKVFTTSEEELSAAGKTSEANENITGEVSQSEPVELGNLVPASSSWTDSGFDLYFDSGAYYNIDPDPSMDPQISVSRPAFDYDPENGDAWGVSLGGIGHIYRGNIYTLEITPEISANNIDYVSIVIDTNTGGANELILTVTGDSNYSRYSDGDNFHFDIYNVDTKSRTPVAIPVTSFEDIDTLVATPYSSINYQPYKILESVDGRIATMTAYSNQHSASGSSITYTIDFNTLNVTKN